MRAIRHIVVHGRVQGVSYRAFVEHEALARGLQGWVRNRRDGTVEALFAGDPGIVVDVIDACRRGSPAARVDTIDQREATPDELKLCRRGEVFSVLATA